jgi:hypothetical protein
MVLDVSVREFLTNNAPLYIHLAVANAKHRPYSVRCFGVNTKLDKENLIGVYLLTSQKEKVLSYLQDGGGRLACLFTDGITNESYQLKGTFVDCRPCEMEEDQTILNYYRKSSLNRFPKLYSKFPLSLSTCCLLTFQVTDIFVQTPGPYAGKKYAKGGVNE